MDSCATGRREQQTAAGQLFIMAQHLVDPAIRPGQRQAEPGVQPFPGFDHTANRHPPVNRSGQAERVGFGCGTSDILDPAAAGFKSQQVAQR